MQLHHPPYAIVCLLTQKKPAMLAFFVFRVVPYSGVVFAYLCSSIIDNTFALAASEHSIIWKPAQT